MRLRRGGIALGLLFAALATTAPAHAQAQPAPAPGVQYVAALHDALDALPAAPTLPRDDPQLDRVRAPLTLARDLSPGHLAVDRILAELDTDPVQVDPVRAAVQTLLQVAELPPGSVASDPNAALRALHDVYGESQFNGLGHGTASNGSLLGRIGQAVLDFFGWLLRNTVGSLGLVPSLLLGALVLAAVIGFVLWRLQRSGTSGGRGRIAAVEPAGRSLDPEEEWRLAEEAAARGDHRQAVRHAFRSALLGIAVAGRLRVDAAWTTAELLSRARGDADLVAALAPAADSFDRAWYSGRPVSEHDWEVGRDRCQAVRALARTRARGRVAQP